MQEQIIKFLENINIGNLICIAGMFWFFYSRLGVKIDKVETKLEKKIDQLDEKVTDIDRRLCRLEGAFSAKECCMIKEDQNLKKAE